MQIMLVTVGSLVVCPPLVHGTPLGHTYTPRSHVNKDATWEDREHPIHKLVTNLKDLRRLCDTIP